MASNSAGGASPYTAAMQQGVQPTTGAAPAQMASANGAQTASVTGGPLVGSQTASPGVSAGNALMPMSYQPSGQSWTDGMSSFLQMLAQISASNPISAIQAATPAAVPHQQGRVR